MSVCLAIHISDARNAASIRRNGLIAGPSKGLWLGSGSYLSLCAALRHFDECVEYGKRFVLPKPTYSGDFVAVVCEIELKGLVKVQNEPVREALENFWKAFNGRLNSSRFNAPANTEWERPRSYLTFTAWRKLTNSVLAAGRRQMSPTQVQSTMCRLLGSPEDDAPIEHPYEICHDGPGRLTPLYIGTPEGAKTELRERLRSLPAFDEVYVDCDHQIAGATLEAARLVTNMQQDDFESLVAGLLHAKNAKFDASSSIPPIRLNIDSRRTKGSARGANVGHRTFAEMSRDERKQRSIARLGAHIRAKDLNAEVLQRDIERAYDDFDRRNLIRVDQLDLPMGEAGSRIGTIPIPPSDAARTLIMRFLKDPTVHPMAAILRALPIVVRNIKTLEGRAYFYPAGELAECSALVVKPGDSARSLFDRAHELGHFVFHEGRVPGSPEQEEEWCDRFAEAFIAECDRTDHFRGLAR